MRALLFAAALLVLTSAAIANLSNAMANPAAQRPSAAPPAASAQFDVRAAWCEQYVDWLISHEPRPNALPTDVRPTHLFEIEFNSCKPNPQQYERETHQQAGDVPLPNALTRQTSPG